MEKPTRWAKGAREIIERIQVEKGLSFGFAHQAALERNLIYWEPVENEWFAGWYKPVSAKQAPEKSLN